MMNKLVWVHKNVQVEKTPDERASPHESTHKSVLQFDYEGTMIGFGVDYEELRDGGVGQFTTALVVREDGFITNVPVHRVKVDKTWQL